MSTWESNETKQLKAEEVVLRSTLAQRPQRPPPLPSSPPPPVIALPKPKNVVHATASTSFSEDSDEGHPSTSSNTCSENEIDDFEAINSSLKLLKFERKSSSPSQEDAAEGLVQQMPYHVLKQIFSRLEIHDRAHVASVCRRWYNVLTDGRCPLGNVIVFNIFQKKIWEDTVNRNAGPTVQCLHIPDLDALVGVLLHVSETCSIKIWYNSPKFAKMVLEKIAEVGVKTKCVDIFPYSDEVGIDVFHEQLPNLTGITMRPHGTKHFWQGLDLFSFPKFEKLDSLILDSFNLKGDLELPESITTFEFQNRRDGSFSEILPKLSKLKNLEYLHVGHADFQGTWTDFVSTIEHEKMPNLQYLFLRFCKFGKDSSAENLELPSSENPDALKMLKVLKMDLCYGYMPRIIRNFLYMTTECLKMVSINMISDESFEHFEQLYDDIAPRLKVRGASLHLGLLQKTENKTQPVLEGTAPEEETLTTYRTPSFEFQVMLSKFESSFCDNIPLLKSLFPQSHYPWLSEVKFIQCPAVTNEVLEAIASDCPRLKKLSLLSCTKFDAPGMLAFVKNFHTRKSETLEIIWKRDASRFSRPAAFYLELTRREHRDLLEGLNFKYFDKSPNDQSSGESIVIKTKTGLRKALIIQDHDHHDTQRILGAVVPFEGDVEEVNEAVVADSGVVAVTPDDPPPTYTPPPIPDDSPINKEYIEVPLTTSLPSTPPATSSSPEHSFVMLEPAEDSDAVEEC